MKTAILFVLLAFVYLVQSRTTENSSSSDNLIDDDSSSSKSPRIVNQPSSELAVSEGKSMRPSNKALKLMLLPTLTFIVTAVLKSQHVVAHMLFGAIMGAVATVATCHYTPICEIALESESWAADRIGSSMLDIISPENLDTLTVFMNHAADTYDAVRTLDLSK